MRMHYSSSGVTAASGMFSSDVPDDGGTSAQSSQQHLTVLPPIFATGAFALVLMAGTGGGVASQTVSGLGQLSNPTSVGYRLVGGLSRSEDNVTEVLSPTVLTRIRAHFGLNMTEFASVARVSRPTVYAWLRGETEPQDANAERVAALARLVRYGARLSPRPVAPYLHRTLANGSTLYELLVHDQIEEARVRAALTQISELMHSETTATASRPSAVELAQRFGYARPAESLSDQILGDESD